MQFTRIQGRVYESKPDNRFADLPKRSQFGNRRFPDPYDYWAAVADLREAGDVAELVGAAQRDWHLRGQTGCLFAQVAALAPADAHWDALVVGADPADLGPAGYGEIGEFAAQATTDADTELASVVFPAARTGLEAVDILVGLARETAFFLERDDITEHDRRLFLRYPVGADVQAWVMAFGPFEFMPNTRRSPYFELVLRVKPKPSEIFHRLNPDRAVAHLADAPLTMTPDRWEHRWQGSRRRTRMVLGGEPTELTAAKMTMSMPWPPPIDGNQCRSPITSP
jgi:hypothetical protein